MKFCKVCQKPREQKHFIGKNNVCKIRPCPTYANKSEFELQEEFFKYIRANHLLKNRVFAVPNGANVTTQVRSKLRKEGMTAGVWDILGLIPNSEYSGFMIEFKDVNGNLTGLQIDWENRINNSDKKYFKTAVFINPKLAYEWVMDYVNS